MSNGLFAAGAETVADAALLYAQSGFAIFPCYTIESAPEGFRCSCGSLDCHSPGKHPIGPLVPHGVSDAQADERAAREWWGASYPDANIGVATGVASGIVVLDVDLGGADTPRRLTDRYGPLPETWLAETGSGGFHFYYRMPDADVRNSAGSIGPGIDVRGTGGYVIAPPSRHRSGGVYSWDPTWHPGRVGLADVPDWLLQQMVRAGRRDRPGTQLGAPIPEGQRNAVLASLGGAMRRYGFSQTAILAALLAENGERCHPPLDEREVARIAASVCRYAPAERAGAPREPTTRPGAPSVVEAPSGAQFFGGPAWRQR